MIEVRQRGWCGVATGRGAVPLTSKRRRPLGSSGPPPHPNRSWGTPRTEPFETHRGVPALDRKGVGGTGKQSCPSRGPRRHSEGTLPRGGSAGRPWAWQVPAGGAGLGQAAGAGPRDTFLRGAREGVRSGEWGE